jgi:hypothetical protein
MLLLLYLFGGMLYEKTVLSPSFEPPSLLAPPDRMSDPAFTTSPSAPEAACVSIMKEGKKFFNCPDLRGARVDFARMTLASKPGYLTSMEAGDIDLVLVSRGADEPSKDAIDNLDKSKVLKSTDVLANGWYFVPLPPAADGASSEGVRGRVSMCGTRGMWRAHKIREGNFILRHDNAIPSRFPKSRHCSSPPYLQAAPCTAIAMSLVLAAALLTAYED